MRHLKSSMEIHALSPKKVMSFGLISRAVNLIVMATVVGALAASTAGLISADEMMMLCIASGILTIITFKLAKISLSQL